MNKIVGLLNLVYGAQKNHPLEFDNPEKVMYISDIAVLEKFRGKGCGSELAKYSIDFTKSLNKYELMYLRTNLVGSMSEGIFKKQGFEIVNDKNGNILTQEVQFERTKPDLPTSDIRKFLIKKI